MADADNNPLSELALQAVQSHPNSNIEVALDFLSKALPSFCKESNDRLVKVGRNISSLISLKDEVPLEESLDLLLQECKILLQDDVKVPKVRFGKTGLQMPIVTLGCMRFQQQWGTNITNINQVNSDCQQNLVEILRRGVIKHGINHIETAWGYGSSQLQLGVALKQLQLAGEIKREDLIIQTKVAPRAETKDFRKMVEESFERLQVDYIDMFAFHGLNGPWHWDMMFGGDDNCWNVIQEYKAAGKIRHIGFSSHGAADLIYRFLETEKFDYANLHYHFCGSYTATGTGANAQGNLPCLQLMKKLDMGVSIISVFDKGGKLYAPSRKLRYLMLPEMEPMTYGMAWLWDFEGTDSEKATVHTVQVGVARAVDFDQCVAAAYWQGKGDLHEQVKTVSDRLHKAQMDALGEDWLNSCYEGVVNANSSKHLVEHNQAIWMYNCMKAWGLHQFAQDRYNTVSNNAKKYDPTLSLDDAIDKIGRGPWGFTPGLPPDAKVDYFLDDLAGVPESNRTLIRAAYQFLADNCAKKKGLNDDGEESTKEDKADIPKEWETSVDMRPWADFPDRPYP